MCMHICALEKCGIKMRGFVFGQVLQLVSGSDIEVGRVWPHVGWEPREAPRMKALHSEEELRFPRLTVQMCRHTCTGAL